jgi:hypothetical protein
MPPIQRVLIALAAIGCVWGCAGREETLPEPVVPVKICSPPQMVGFARPVGLPEWTGGRLNVSVQVGADGRLVRAWLPGVTEAQAAEMKERLAFALQYVKFTPAQDCQGEPVEGVLTDTWVAVE